MADTKENTEVPPQPNRHKRSRRISMRGRISRAASRVEVWAIENPSKRVRFAAFVVRLFAQTVRQWVRDKCPQQAASLAFQTVLSVVPVTAVILASFRIMGALDAKSSLVSFLSEELIPVSPAKIASQLNEWSENITFESLGAIGLVSTLVLAFIMYNSLERVMNQIWRAERKRPYTQRFAAFYIGATVGAFFTGVTVYQATQIGLTKGYSGFLLGFLSTFSALFLLNYFMPACKVRISSAAIGSTLTAVLFELAKYGFNQYVNNFAYAGYAGIYGAVAIVPLLLIWIYWSWIILLLGVEVSHATQNIQLLARVDRRTRLSYENELVQRVTGPVAARIMVAVSTAYMTGEQVLSRTAIADRFDLSDEVLARVTDRLKAAELLMEVQGDNVGFLPARPPHEITLKDVLQAFRGDDVDAGTTPGDQGRLEEVLRDIEADAVAKTRNLTLDKLVIGKK